MSTTGTDRALDFLRKFHPDGFWTLTSIQPDRKAIETKTFTADTDDEAEKWVEKYNGKRNIYFSVNQPNGPVTKKCGKEDIAFATCLHVDLDCRAGEPLDAELERLKRLVEDEQGWPETIPRPQVAVHSGGGYQCFWLLDKPVEIGGDIILAQDFERYNKALELALGGDNCHNVDRIMRLPGTINLPDENKRKKGRTAVEARVIFFNDLRVSLDKFEQAPPLLPPDGSKHKVDIGSNVPRIADLDELDQWSVSEKTKQVISQGKLVDPEDWTERQKGFSRSEWCFYGVCELVRKDVPDEIIYSLITDPQFGISEHVLYQKNIENYAVRQIERAKEQLDTSPIVVTAGRIHDLVALMEHRLVRSEANLFQRGQTLVRLGNVSELSRTGKPDIDRDPKSLIMHEVGRSWLGKEACRHMQFAKLDKEELPYVIDPPTKLINAYVESVGEWNVRPLLGITQTPTLRPDGSVLQTPGYDAASHLYYEPGDVVFPPVPENPTQDDAQKGLQRLANLFRKFPFVSEPSRSVAMAAVMTTLVRGSIPTAPLFAFDAPTAGTGKSLIVDTASVIATGHKAAMMSQGKSPEEDEKRLSSVLMAGDPIIVFDNCDVPVHGDFLCSMLTQEIVQARVLGKSERLQLPSAATVMVTGNNLTLAGDVTRRAMLCRMDAQLERPDSRQFKFSPTEEALADRAQLVVDILTALRAYRVAGNPNPMPKIGSFEGWNWIRETLVWCGYEDPAITREQVLADDPRKNELLELLHAWYAVLGDEEHTVAEVKAFCDADHTDERRHLLRDLLVGLTPYNELKTKSVGNQLKKHLDRLVGDYKLVRTQETRSGYRWAVINLKHTAQATMDYSQFGGAA